MIALRNAFSFAKYTVFPRIPIKLGFYPFFVTHAQCCMNVMCVFILSTSESICANLTIETVVKITFIRDLNILSNKDPFHFMVEYPALKKCVNFSQSRGVMHWARLDFISEYCSQFRKRVRISYPFPDQY